MKFSYNWLKELSGSRASASRMAEVLTLHSFEARVAQKRNNDTILEIDILPNRAHEGFSHISVARELAALLGSKLAALSHGVKEDKSLETKNFVSIKVASAHACPRYAARYIEGVTVGPSPSWLKKPLELLGLNSINNIVDAANYVMLEMGQPLHAFDAAKIAKDKNRHAISVRMAKTKESIVTLDGVKREVPPGVLLIADAHKPLAVAGIKGGQGSEIGAETKSIIIEAANFNSHIVRHGVKTLGVLTDASARFSQNLSPELVGVALDRVAHIIQKTAGGIAYKGIAENYPRKLIPRKILFNTSYSKKISGIDVSQKEAKRIFERLGFSVKIINPVAELPHLIERAKKFVGTPYKYGASTAFDAPKLFDCSSFVKYLYREIGIELPRVTIDQIQVGKSVSQKELQPGDLVFAKGRKPHFIKKYPSGVGHVGIYIGDKKIINAVGMFKRVVEEPIGTFLKRENLRAIRRILDESYNQDFLLVSISPIRLDIEQEEDLIEEVVRMKGYNAIKARMPHHQLAAPSMNEAMGWNDMVRKLLASLGFDEVYNIAFVSEGELRSLSLLEEPRGYIEVANPLSAQFTYMRPTLFISLLNNARDNARFFDAYKLFELGKVYQRGIGMPPFVHEKKSCVGMYASKTARQKEMFFEMKGLLDALFEKIGLTDVWYDDYKPYSSHASRALWQEGICAEIKAGNKSVGFVGAIQPRAAKAFDVKNSIVAFELDIPALVARATSDRTYEEIPKYPAIERDISLLVPLDARMVEITNVVESLGGVLLENMDLIDSYEGGALPGEKQSMTFRLVFRSRERTLSDEEVNTVMEKIAVALKRKNWEIR